jgi:hypothetical protein
MYIDLIRRLEEEGLVVNLVPRLRVFLNPLTMWRTWKTRHLIGPNPIEAIRKQIRGKVRQVPVWGAFPGLSAPVLARIVRQPSRRAARVVLHARQIVMGRLALSLKRWWRGLRVVSELEGDGLAELQYRRTEATRRSPARRIRWWVEERLYSHAECSLVRESDAILCVSHKLKDVLVQRYRLTPEQAGKMAVFPSVASRRKFRFDAEKREETRRTLQVQGRFLVIYNGNLNASWQVPEKLVETFVLIRQARPTAFFLVLTPERDRQYIEPHLRQARLSTEDYRLHSCQHEEVVDYLCGSDVGLLLRDRHPMNEVAAPGKFAEYVLAGLPIIMTEGIGDFSTAMQDSEYACVLPSLDSTALRDAVPEFCRRDVAVQERMAFSQWGAERFAIELYVPRLAALYRTV